MDAQTELASTLDELISAFGPSTVANAIRESSLAKEFTPVAQTSALRAYTVLILESPRPHLIANLVCRLTGLDVAAGRPKSLSELGRENNLTKQAVSKKLAELADQLYLPRPLSTEKARESYRLMNRRNYGS